MKRYWVLGYDIYYPSSDNFMESFETYEEAEAYVESEQAKPCLERHDRYEIIDIIDRL